LIPHLSESQVVTVFRSRLRADANPAFEELAEEMETAARQVPGFVDFKTFAAEDGERVSLVTFASSEAHCAWRDDPRHRQAQRRGREEFYEDYSIQVSNCVHVHQWESSGDG
jgi:heme-degrading monooxygenase HmoA